MGEASLNMVLCMMGAVAFMLYFYLVEA